MARGFVYILLNPSFPDQVKLGLTERESEVRAKELRTTGVPTPFIVVYDELVSDCEKVEQRLHAKFDGYRVAGDREFFRIPVKEAIRALQEIAKDFRLTPSLLSNRLEILPRLMSGWPKHFAPDLVSVELVKLPALVFVEYVRRTDGDPQKEIVGRIEMYRLRRYSNLSKSATIEEYADKFIYWLGGYGILDVSELLIDDVVESIEEEYNRIAGFD